MRTDETRSSSVQTVMQAANRVADHDERMAKTEADLERSISNRLKINSATLSMPIPAAFRKVVANEVRIEHYRRTRNAPKYCEEAIQSATQYMAISDDSIKAENAAVYQRFMEQTKTVPDSVKISPDFVQHATMMKTLETHQVASILNGLAWTCVEIVTDPADLKQALAWSGRSIELERSAEYLDTYAQLLGKLGRKTDAINAQKEAIVKAKATGEDTVDYEKTLAELKK